MRSTDPPRRAFVVSTIAIAALSVGSSLLGLLRQGHYADPASLVVRTRVEDLLILVFAVPVLVLGLRFASGQSPRGRIVWLGSLAYLAYVWLSRAGMLAINDFFLGYIALVALSVFTLIGGIVTTDPRRISRRLAGRVPRRLFAGILLLTSIGLAALWLSDIVPATLAGTTPLGIQEFGPRGAITYVLDLGLLVPSYAIGAFLLWERTPWGYVTTGVLLVLAALIAPTLAAITIVDLQQGVSMTPGVVIGTVLPPAVPGTLAIWYLVVLGRNRSDGRTNDRRVES